MNNFWDRFWDRDGNGKFDLVDIFWLALQLICYSAGVAFMASTFARSFHLLSSPQMNPGAFDWWPWLTAISPEIGLVIAWLAGEVGFRKGRLELVGLSAVGFVAFAVVVATLQLYDVALVNGSDITVAQTWAHWVASVLPLITISYSAVASMLLSYMARREKLRGVEVKQTIGTSWQVGKREQMELPAKTPYGSPVSDPLRRERARQLVKTKVTEVVAGRNGAGEESDFPL